MKRIFILLLVTALIFASCGTVTGDTSKDTSSAESNLSESLGEVSDTSSDVSDAESSQPDEESQPPKEVLPVPADIGIGGMNLHMQGFAVDLANKYMYWSFTDTIVKTDFDGKMLGKVSFEDGHLGDLTIVDGKVYGTLLGDPNDGDAWDSWTGYYVVVYDEYLTRQSKTSLDKVFDMSTGKSDNPNGVYAIDGIAYGKNASGKSCLFIAAGTKIDAANTKQVIFEYTVSLEYKNQYVYETGNTPYGIQNLEYDFETNNLWFTTYGQEESYQTKNTLYRLKSDLSEIEVSNEFSTPYGLACLGKGRYLISADGTTDDGGKVGYAFVALLSQSETLSREFTGYPALEESKQESGDPSQDEPSQDDPGEDTKIVDDTGNGYDLTFNNVSIIPDHSNAVLASDGSTMYCEAKELGKSITENGGASVSLWANPSGIIGDYVYVGGLQSADGNYALCLEYCWGESVLRLLRTDKDYSETAYCGAVKLNEWTHYLLTLDNEKACIYINGVLAGGFTVVSGTVLKDISYISFCSVNVEAPFDKNRRCYTGMLDDIAIYDKALTEADALSLYGGKKAGTLPVAEYSFASEEGEPVNIMERKEVNGFSLWTENWRKDVLPSDLVPVAPAKAVSISAARNDTEAFQICCRSSVSGKVNSIKLTDLSGKSGIISASTASARAVGYYEIKDNTFELSDPIATAPTKLPEKLFNTSESDITLFETQPFWISYYIPADAAPGDYTGKATVSTTFGDYEIEISLKVYATIIPTGDESAFSLEMWNQYVKCFEDVSGGLDVINKAYGIETYSDKWWALMETYAAFMKQNRMNVLFLNTIDLLKDAPGTKVNSSGEVTYDWSLLDKFVELFLEKGEIKMLSAEHLCAQSVNTDKEKSYKLEIIVADGDKNGKSYIPIEEGIDYLEDYLAVLNRHLTEKGWKDMWLQHIGDEPTGDKMPENYRMVSETVRRICTGVKTGDAFYGENASEFDDSMDIWIPITTLYAMQQDFFDEKKDNGNDLWLYTASYPGGLYLNRFVDSQLYKSELLSWLCYKCGATGYLHWGLMEWYVWESFSNTDTTIGNNNVKYNGDSWCIYPDKENMSIISSVRVEALREACEDYELLTLLAEKDSKAADKLVKEMITDETHYETDIAKIASIREQILKLLNK